MLTSVATRRNKQFQRARLDPCQPPMPSQHTSGSYGSFHDPRLPGPGPPLPGATHVDLPGDASSDQRRAGRFVAFLIIVVLGALVLRAYQQNEPNEEVGKERMRCERELATERERWREELRRELERWERALGRHVPQGAFWDGVWPAVDCRAYDTREYWGTLQNIPKHWTDLEACMNMPVEIKGVGIRRPYRCAYVKGSPHIRGYWMVGWDQPDCRPWLRDFHDKVRGRTMNSTH